jgi:hypothetical protein
MDFPDQGKVARALVKDILVTDRLSCIRALTSGFVTGDLYIVQD